MFILKVNNIIRFLPQTDRRAQQGRFSSWKKSKKYSLVRQFFRKNFSATNILKTFYGHLKIFIAEKFSRIKKKEFSKFYDGWPRCFISILKIIRFRLKRELISWLHWTYISFGVFCLFYSIKQQAYEIPRPVYYLLRKGFRQFCLVHIPFPNDGGNPAVINVPVYETEQEKPSESISKENNSHKYHSFLWTWSKGDQTVHI